MALILGRYFFSFIQKKTLTELRLVHFRRQVAETCLGNTMQRQIAPRTGEFLRKSLFLQQNLVVATGRKKKSNQTEFVRLAATTKILLQIQRFSQKFSSTNEAICHSDVSSQCVVATSRPICAHGVICRRDA